MQGSKEEKIVQVLTVFSDFTGKKLSLLAQTMFIEIMEPYPIEKIEAAATHLLKTRKWNNIPLPADFLEYLDPPEQAQIKSNEAWRTLLYAFRRYGYYTTVQFADAAITQTVIAMGGWLELYNRYFDGKDGEMWTQKEFEQRYTGYSKLPRLRNEILIGWCDAENDEENPVPVLIGEPERKLIEEAKADMPAEVEK